MNLLHFLRVKARLTQAEVAERLNVNQSAVSNWERGINPPLPKYRPQLAKLYGVTEAELMKGAE